jgi:hypothetical protein
VISDIYHSLNAPTVPAITIPQANIREAHRASYPCGSAQQVLRPYQTLPQAYQAQKAPKVSRSFRAGGSTLIKTILHPQSTAHPPHVHLNNHDSWREPLSTKVLHNLQIATKYREDLQVTADDLSFLAESPGPEVPPAVQPCRAGPPATRCRVGMSAATASRHCLVSVKGLLCVPQACQGGFVRVLCRCCADAVSQQGARGLPRIRPRLCISLSDTACGRGQHPMC